MFLCKLHLVRGEVLHVALVVYTLRGHIIEAKFGGGEILCLP